MLFPSNATRLTQSIGRAFRLIETWLDVSRQRRRLAAMDDRMLKDIGISRASANNEARKPFWDVPEAAMPASAAKEAPKRCCAPDCCTEPATA